MKEVIFYNGVILPITNVEYIMLKQHDDKTWRIVVTFKNKSSSTNSLWWTYKESEKDEANEAIAEIYDLIYSDESNESEESNLEELNSKEKKDIV